MLNNLLARALCLTLLLSFSNATMAGVNEDLLQASKSGNLNEVSRLLEIGADVNTKDKNDNTPLHLAASLDTKIQLNYWLLKALISTLRPRVALPPYLRLSFRNTVM